MDERTVRFVKYLYLHCRTVGKRIEKDELTKLAREADPAEPLQRIRELETVNPPAMIGVNAVKVECRVKDGKFIDPLHWTASPDNTTYFELERDVLLQILAEHKGSDSLATSRKPFLPLPPSMLHWDADKRELSCDGNVIKRFRKDAKNGMTVLAVFEEEDWPESIENPLSPDASLKRTVANLNSGLCGIQFSVGGTEDFVRWRSGTRPVP